jgi:Type II secretion system (T2SS), protein E, N-terminal domain
MNTHGPLADALLRSGVVDAAGLARALEAHASRPSTTTTLGRVISDLGLADEAAVARALAAALRLGYHDAPATIDPALSALLPLDFCKKRRTFPVALQGKSLHVAVTDPLDLAVIQDVEFRTGKKATPVVVT